MPHDKYRIKDLSCPLGHRSVFRTYGKGTDTSTDRCSISADSVLPIKEPRKRIPIGQPSKPTTHVRPPPPSRPKATPSLPAPIKLILGVGIIGGLFSWFRYR